MDFINIHSGIIMCVFVSLATSYVVPDEAHARVLKYVNTNDGSGNYKFSYETSNGITREEEGRLVNRGLDDEHMVVEGSYSYTDDNGAYVYVQYTADQNGYRILPPVTDLVPQVVYSLPPSVVATLLG